LRRFAEFRGAVLSGVTLESRFIVAARQLSDIYHNERNHEKILKNDGPSVEEFPVVISAYFNAVPAFDYETAKVLSTKRAAHLNKYYVILEPLTIITYATAETQVYGALPTHHRLRFVLSDFIKLRLKMGYRFIF